MKFFEHLDSKGGFYYEVPTNDSRFVVLLVLLRLY